MADQKMRRKIAVVTGSRAEYGLLYWLLKEIQNDPELELQLLVTGMHLSPEFGLTYRLIEQDGFTIAAKVESQLSSDTSVGIAKSVGLGVIGFADVYNYLEPDLIVLLGDRFEIFAAAQAAMITRIPIAHVFGGEGTEGLIDEPIRHAITKLAALHFVAADVYRRRVIQLGELPERVYSFGSPGLDHLDKTILLNKKELEKILGFTFGKLNFLVTYHNVTLQRDGPQQAMKELLQALDYFPEAKIIFTGTNADTEGRIINRIIEDYLIKYPNRGKFFISLGLVNYLSVIKQIDVVIGNSSSGLIEIPFLGRPTINIGDRQKGRLIASSVINCPESSTAIIVAIEHALAPSFQDALKDIVTPYKKGDVSYRIKEVIKKIPLEKLIIKNFYDISLQLNSVEN